MLSTFFLFSALLQLTLAEYYAPSADQVKAIKELVQDALKEEKDFIPTCLRLGK